eukprot:4508506-Pleurochrysis_carterae.AAC.1
MEEVHKPNGIHIELVARRQGTTGKVTRGTEVPMIAREADEAIFRDFPRPSQHELQPVMAQYMNFVVKTETHSTVQGEY